MKVTGSLHYRLSDSHDKHRQQRAFLRFLGFYTTDSGTHVTDKDSRGHLFGFWVSTLQTQWLKWQTKTAEGIPFVSGFVHYRLSDSHDRQRQRRASPMSLHYRLSDSHDRQRKRRASPMFLNYRLSDSHDRQRPVSYTHLTLPTRRTV